MGNFSLKVSKEIMSYLTAIMSLEFTMKGIARKYTPFPVISDHQDYRESQLLNLHLPRASILGGYKVSLGLFHSLELEKSGNPTKKTAIMFSVSSHELWVQNKTSLKSLGRHRGQTEEHFFIGEKIGAPLNILAIVFTRKDEDLLIADIVHSKWKKKQQFISNLWMEVW